MILYCIHLTLVAMFILFGELYPSTSLFKYTSLLYSTHTFLPLLFPFNIPQFHFMYAVTILQIIHIRKNQQNGHIYHLYLNEINKQNNKMDENITQIYNHIVKLRIPYSIYQLLYIHLPLFFFQSP